MTAADRNGDVALACLCLLVDELHRGGVRDVHMSPGSRSTPLVLAFARDGRMNVTVHADERSSAFAALGRALIDGAPCAVVASSGTAVGNWLPAIIEASMAHVPMIALSADRPAELRGTGANQTIDQRRIFGSFVRSFSDAEVPQEGGRASGYWRSLGNLAVARALGPVPGPVHLNLPIREPLIPGGGGVALGGDTRGRPGGAPWEPIPEPSAWNVTPETIEAVAALLSSTSRGLVVAAPAAPALAGRAAHRRDPVAVLAALLGWPLVAEPTSGSRTGPPALTAGTLLLGDSDFTAAHMPEVVMQIGATPTSRAVLATAAATPALVVLTPDGREADPAQAAKHTLHGHPPAVASALADALRARTGTPSGRSDPGWLAAWTTADAVAAAAVDASFRALGDTLFEGAVAREVAAALPDGTSLLIGNSMPVRDLDAFMVPRAGLRVIGNRGASGIDGMVSTAVGMAAATPAVALLGDLTLLHDVGALTWNGRRPLDLVLVVVNNDGGGIFGLLPSATLPEYERFFATPHGLHFDGIAVAAGAGYRRVDRMSALRPALLQAVAASRAHRVQVVEVVTGRTEGAVVQTAIRETIRAALAGMTTPAER